MQDSNVDSMVEALKQGIDNNGTDAPSLSIDPKSKQVSVVGDPNKVDETKGSYKITFTYPGSELSPEDKAKMKKVEDSDEEEYTTTITYHGCRVKPLHRTKVGLYVAEVLTRMGVLLEDGSYTTDTLNRRSAAAFLDYIDKVAEIAKITLDIPDDQVQYMNADSLIEFFLQMLNNEPNVVKEAGGFLEPSLIKKLAKAVSLTNQQQSTPQS